MENGEYHVLLLIIVSFVTLGKASELRTLEFYLHDVDANPKYTNATNVVAASPKNGNFTTFGSIIVIDDPLTEGPSIHSKLIGRARGIFVTDSLAKDLGIFISFTASFQNGSTLILQGHDTTSFPVQEISVSGGTGEYRFAVGYAQITIRKWSLGAFAVLFVKVFFRLD